MTRSRLLTSPVAGLTTLLLAGGLAAAVPSAAQAVPSVAGEYVAVTPAVVRTVVPGECRDVVDIKAVVDLQGIGNQVAAQGYYDEEGDPVYTNLMWDWSIRVNGPSNFYATDSSTYNIFPDAEESETLELCPDDFAGGVVVPGTYTVESTFVVGNPSYSVDSICSKVEGCRKYPSVYQKTLTQTFTVVAEGPSAACTSARAALTKAQAKLKKAKAAHKKKAVRKAKAKVRSARTLVGDRC